MQNIVVNMCKKFHNDRLRNDRSSGNGKSDNSKKKNINFRSAWRRVSGSNKKRTAEHVAWTDRITWSLLRGRRRLLRRRRQIRSICSSTGGLRCRLAGCRPGRPSLMRRHGGSSRCPHHLSDARPVTSAVRRQRRLQSLRLRRRLVRS